LEAVKKSCKSCKNLPYSWRHSRKICNTQPKIFFRVQTRRLANLFGPLDSSLAQSGEELWRW